MMAKKRRQVKLYLPGLGLVLIVLYLGLAGVQSSTAEMIPTSIQLEPVQDISQQDIAAAGEVLRRRLSIYQEENSRLGLTVEEGGLSISLPSGHEPSILVAEASRLGQVELVDGGTEFLPLNRVVETGPEPIPDQDVYQAVLSSTDFETAEAGLGDQSRPIIHFKLNPAGDARLNDHTAELRGYYLCLVVDGRVVNCPIVRTPLTDRQGTIELTGDANLDDARKLAMLLRSGPLPVRLRLSQP